MNKTMKKGKKCKRKMTKKNYKQIANKLKPISKEEIQKDYNKLKEITCKQISKIGNRSRIGNTVVDAYTLEERLHAKGDQGISFYDFWNCRDYYSKKEYVRKMLDFYKTRNTTEIRKYRYTYNLYFSNIAIFSPLRAMDIYCKTNARRVLDFTMGWGGRLVGGCAYGLEMYYGIDINVHLKKPYKKMVDFLKSDEDNNTKIQLKFEDALKVDYSKMDYDTVLTSPPYYNIEVYRKSEGKYKSKEDWNNNFYKPLFSKTFKHLKNGGKYCLNVPVEIYESVCVPLLGKSNKKYHLKKEERIKGKSNYKEYVYCWYK